MASKCWLTKTEGEAMWLKILHLSLKSGSSYEIRHSIGESKYFYLNNNVLNGKIDAFLWTKPYGGFLFVIHHLCVTLRRPPQDFEIVELESSGQRLFPWKITSTIKGGRRGFQSFFFDLFYIWFVLKIFPSYFLLLFFFYICLVLLRKKPWSVLCCLDERLDVLCCLDEQACCAGCRRRSFTAEAPPIGKIHPFRKIAVPFEP